MWSRLEGRAFWFCSVLQRGELRCRLKASTECLGFCDSRLFHPCPPLPHPLPGASCHSLKQGLRLSALPFAGSAQPYPLRPPLNPAPTCPPAGLPPPRASALASSLPAHPMQQASRGPCPDKDLRAQELAPEPLSWVERTRLCKARCGAVPEATGEAGWDRKVI